MATVNTHGIHGRISKTVTVKSNDPERSLVTLTVKARVGGSVQLFPGARLSISTRGDREPVGRLLVRKEPDETGTLSITGLASNVPWLKLSARKLDKPEAVAGTPPAEAGDWVVEVRAEGDLVGGENTGEIEFRTGLPKEPVVRVPVTVVVPPAVTFSPLLPILRAPEEGKPAEAVVDGLLRKGVDPASLVIETDSPGLKAEFERVPGSPRAVRLKLSWEASEAKPDRRGMVTVKTPRETVRLPVRVGSGVAASAPKS